MSLRKKELSPALRIGSHETLSSTCIEIAKSLRFLGALSRTVLATIVHIPVDTLEIENGGLEPRGALSNALSVLPLLLRRRMKLLIHHRHVAILGRQRYKV